MFHRSNHQEPPQSTRSSSSSSTTTTTTTGRSLSAVSDYSQEELNLEVGRINGLMDQAYTLVWQNQDYEQAIVVLKKVLVLQEKLRGKYHRETGYTYSFIGSTLWFNQDCHTALMYLCEARRIFHRLHCDKNKAGSGGGAAAAVAETVGQPSIIPPESKTVRQIRDRMTKILQDLNMSPSAIADYHETLDSAVKHEEQRWHYQQMGDAEMARLERNKARTCSETLKRATMHRKSRYGEC